jgi:hypothetical protein
MGTEKEQIKKAALHCPWQTGHNLRHRVDEMGDKAIVEVETIPLAL